MAHLALPRKVYTQSHMDYMVETIIQIKKHQDRARGYRFTYAPELLRRFTAHFEPVI
jgi:tryptophanase